MAYLYALVFLLLLPLESIAALIETPVASLPTSTVAGATRIVIDGATEDDCSLGGGVYNVLCTFDGVSTWVPGGGGGGSTAPAVTLDQAFDNGQEIDNATTANPLIVGNDTQKGKHYGDPSKGYVVEPVPLGDSIWRCWTNFNCVIRDEEAATSIFTIDPDAASKNAMYQFGTNYKPTASFLLPLEPRGAATSAAESLTTNVEKTWYLTVTDADTDAADFSFPVTARMAGATIATFRLIGASNNASPSGNIAFDCAMTTYTPGTDTLAAHNTTGQQRITLTPATQYRPVAGTSAAHTINGGALVEGDIVYGSCEVDATATTSAQMSNFRLWGNVLVQLSVNSWSD